MSPAPWQRPKPLTHLEPADLQAALQGITPELRRQLQQQFAAETQRLKNEGKWTGTVRAHVEYQQRPVEWVVDKLGIPEHTIRWSLNPEYSACRCETEVCNAAARALRGSPAHIWDGAVDPLAQGLEALARGDDFACPSGTGTGKTIILAACGALYFLAAWERSIVVSIAPKQEQLLLNMWKEMGELFPKFKRHFPDATFLTGKLRMLAEEGGQEVWAATATVARVDADEEVAQNLKGLHGAHMYWLIEEGPGNDPAIVKTIINTATGSHNPIGMLGNPESMFDPLALFAKRESTREFRISAYDHPNLVCGRDVIPGAVSPKSVRNRLVEDASGDVNDPIYKAQVRGIAPEQAAQSLVKIEWLEQAAARYNDPAFRIGELAIGADPANSEQHGKAAIARGQGACLTEIEQRVCRDAGVFGDQLVREARANGISPLHVAVDGVGVGASTINEARRQEFFLQVVYGSEADAPTIDEELRYRPREDGSDPVNPQGEVVLMAEQCYRRRDRILWRLREDLRLGRIAIPPRHHCPAFWNQLLAHTWSRPNGKIKMIVKEDLIEILGSSPDCSDAAALWNWIRPRRPAPIAAKVPTVQERKQRDTHYERMMAERSVEMVSTVSRRPF